MLEAGKEDRTQGKKADRQRAGVEGRHVKNSSLEKSPWSHPTYKAQTLFTVNLYFYSIQEQGCGSKAICFACRRSQAQSLASPVKEV